MLKWSFNLSSGGATPSWIPSTLVLENGEKFSGQSPDWNCGTFYGEVVFTTGMTGYPETLTDPSYAGQILCFTYPLVGNYGVPSQELWESKKIHARGVIVNEACLNFYHYQGAVSFVEWLHFQGIPLIVGVDTRALTKLLRLSGTMLGAITSEKKENYSYENPNTEHLVAQVSVEETIIHKHPTSDKIVYAIDCGMKENIARSLLRMPIEVRRVPYNYDFTEEYFDGVFISNGPGDPEMCPETVEIVSKALEKNKPIFGICLGIQIMALAVGARTYKLLFGHRGHNQPCIDTSSKKCFITSQNHSYAVEEVTLPVEWNVTYRNLNDNSVAGIAHKTKPFFAVQFHPEAAPGPTDTHWLFEKFYKML